MKEIKNYLHLYLGCQYRIAYIETPTTFTIWSILTAGRLAKLDDASIVKIEIALRHLSDMTEEERTKYLSFWGNEVVNSRVEASMKRDAEATRYLLSKHFDLFGLIEAGLALPLNTPQQ